MISSSISEQSSITHVELQGQQRNMLLQEVKQSSQFCTISLQALDIWKSNYKRRYDAA
jgi:hypothetical protein